MAVHGRVGRVRGAVLGNPGLYGRCLICSWTPGTSDSTPRVPLSESTLTRTSIRSGPTPVVVTRSNTRLESSGSRFHHPPVTASTTTPINPVNRISRTREALNKTGVVSWYETTGEL